MGSNQENFKLNLAFGKEGEHEIGEYLINMNYTILPLYQFDDNITPKIFTSNSTITSPDLFVSGNGKCFWIEVKTKNRWIKYFDDVETGCDYRLYKDYLKIQESTELPVYLIFNHKEMEPVGYFSILVKKPLHRIWDGLNCKTGKKISPPMALWLIKDLNKINK